LAKRATLGSLPFKLRPSNTKPNANTHAYCTPLDSLLIPAPLKRLKTIRRHSLLPFSDLSQRIALVFANAAGCSQSAPTPPSNVPKKDVNATAIAATLASAEQASTLHFFHLLYVKQAKLVRLR